MTSTISRRTMLRGAGAALALPWLEALAAPSRKPPVRLAWIHVPMGVHLDAWNDAVHDPATGIVTYGTHYEIQSTGKHLSAASRIAFPEKAELEVLIAQAGLSVERWLGDWQGNGWHEGAKEFIPLGGRL